jgi:hypothetical protein
MNLKHRWQIMFSGPEISIEYVQIFVNDPM